MNASVSVVCYKSKTLSNGEHPLMLRISKDNRKKYLSLGVSILPKYWDIEKNRPTSKCPNKELIEKIILDKQVEYQRQILEFIAEQKEYRVSSLVESKREKLKNKTVEEFKKYYPFNEFKISKFDTSTKKRAVSKEDVMKIVKAGLEQATYWRILARDVFMFSYLSGGISFTDIANLTMDNIDRGRLLYSRQKTHGAIDFKINSNALDLIDKYAYHRKKAIYLFPILDANVHKTPLQKKNRIHKILGRVNKELKALAFE